VSKQTAGSNKRATIQRSQEARLEKAERERRRKEKQEKKASKGLTGETADNFRAYLSILHEWDAKDKLKSNVRED